MYILKFYVYNPQIIFILTFRKIYSTVVSCETISYKSIEKVTPARNQIVFNLRVLTRETGLFQTLKRAFHAPRFYLPYLLLFHFPLVIYHILSFEITKIYSRRKCMDTTTHFYFNVKCASGSCHFRKNRKCHSKIRRQHSFKEYPFF